MPLVKIDVIKGRRSPAQLRTLADTVQTVMLQKFKAPPKDRYQVSLPALQHFDVPGC
jgi:phenylpyruvate tautomerase PptA (4-oxalocrotonate tautomerase family)